MQFSYIVQHNGHYTTCHYKMNGISLLLDYQENEETAQQDIIITIP
jgi:hypothetical protein